MAPPGEGTVAVRTEEGPSGPPSSFERTHWAQYGSVVVGCAVVFFALGVVMLHPYVTRGFRYPLGWDAAFYVWRAEAIPVDGLDRLGAIRAGLPLLLAILGQVTGRDAFTLVTAIPPVLAGVAGLGTAAMLRAAFGLPAAWLPVAGFLAWAAFGPNEIPLHHLDNLLNAALVLGGFAAALAFVAAGRGVVAAGLLFAAAGVAHWPFYGFAMGVFVLGVVLHAWPALRRGRPLDGPAGPLLGAAAASGAAVGLTLLAPPPSGWFGARPGTLRAILRERIAARLDDPNRFYAFAVAAGSAAALWRGPRSEDGGPARRLFGWLIAAWAGLTLAAVVAQAAGLPTAGARILSFFFPVSLLTALATWWVARWAARRWRGAAGAVAAAAVAGAAVGGFGWLMWESWDRRHPWFEEPAVAQVTAAAAYVERVAPAGPVVFVLDLRGREDPHTLGRWWLVVKASLPPELVPRAHRYVGSPADYLAAVPSRPLGEGLPPGESDRPDPELRSPNAVAVVIERYNPRGFEEAAADAPDRVVAPGVLVLRGPPAGPAVDAGPPPSADSRAWTLLWVSAALVLLLLAAGSGWAVALFPADPFLRTALAPALGAATVSLLGLGWAAAGLSLDGGAGAGPVVLAFAGGWAAVLVGRRRRG